MSRFAPIFVYVLCFAAATGTAVGGEPLSVCLAREKVAVAARTISVGLEGRQRSGDRDIELVGAVEDALRRFGAGVFATKSRVSDAPDLEALVRPLDEAAARRATLLVAVRLEAREYELPREFVLAPGSRTVAIVLTAIVVDSRSRDVLATRNAPSRNIIARSTPEALSQLLAERGTYADLLADLLTQACEARRGGQREQEAQVAEAIPEETSPPPGKFVAGARGTEQPLPIVSGTPGRHRAVVVGVADYLNLNPYGGEPITGLTDLRYSRHDAEAFSEFLRDKGRSGGEWEVFQHLDQEATNARLDRILGEVLIHARDNDIIMFFFSGHARQDTANDNEVFLLTADFDPNYHGAGYPYSRLRGMIEKSPAMQIVSFIDACHSGQSSIAKGAGTSFDKDRLIIESRTGRMRTVFASASGPELSFESDELRHGVFTYFLLEAITKKRKDLESKKVVPLRSIAEYVEQKVAAYTTEYHEATQHPRILGDYGGQFDGWPVAIGRR